MFRILLFGYRFGVLRLRLRRTMTFTFCAKGTSSCLIEYWINCTKPQFTSTMVETMVLLVSVWVNTCAIMSAERKERNMEKHCFHMRSLPKCWWKWGLNVKCVCSLTIMTLLMSKVMLQIVTLNTFIILQCHVSPYSELTSALLWWTVWWYQCTAESPWILQKCMTLTLHSEPQVHCVFQELCTWSLIACIYVQEKQYIEPFKRAYHMQYKWY